MCTLAMELSKGLLRDLNIYSETNNRSTSLTHLSHGIHTLNQEKIQATTCALLFKHLNVTHGTVPNENASNKKRRE